MNIYVLVSRLGYISIFHVLVSLNYIATVDQVEVL